MGACTGGDGEFRGPPSGGEGIGKWADEVRTSSQSVPRLKRDESSRRKKAQGGKEVWFIMAKRVKQGGFVSVLFVLAAAVVLGTGLTADAAEFGFHYKSSAGQEGYVTSVKDITTEIPALKEMFLGEELDFTTSDDYSGVWDKVLHMDALLEEKIEYVNLGMGTGKAHFLKTVKPGETGRLLLQPLATAGEETSFDLKGITAKSPVSMDLDKAAIAIDTSKASEDKIVVSITSEKGAVSQDLKVAGVSFDFDHAKLDAAKLSLAWDGAKKEIQAKALDAAYIAKGVPVKAEIGFTFVGCDGQDWALSEDVNFTVTSGPGHPATVTVTATAGAGGTIAPSGAVTVAYGADQAFTISPDINYKIKDVKVNGASIGAVAAHTMKNVTSDGTIEATFEKTSGGGGGGSGGGGGCNAGYAFLALLGLLPLALRMKKR